MERLRHSLDTRFGYWTVAIFALALAVRLCFVLGVPVKPTAGGDPLVFEQTALSLLHEGVPHSQEGYASRSPFYSFLIAAVYGVFGENHRNLFIAQSVVGAAGVVLLFLILKRLGMLIALIGTLLATLHPLLLFYTEQVLTESLYTFFMILSVYLAILTLERGSPFGLLTGAVLGLLILTRAEAAIFGGLVILGLILTPSLWSRRIKSAGAIALMVLVVLTPWLVRNWLVLGGPTLATEGGITLYMAHSPETTGGYIVPRQLPDLPSGELEKSNFYYRQAFEFILKHPLTSLSYIPRKLASLWQPYHNQVLDGADWALVTFAIIGMMLALRDRLNWRYYYLLVIPILAVHTTTAIFVGLPRYRAPLAPFFIAFAALALAWIGEWFATHWDLRQYRAAVK